MVSIKCTSVKTRLIRGRHLLVQMDALGGTPRYFCCGKVPKETMGIRIATDTGISPSLEISRKNPFYCSDFAHEILAIEEIDRKVNEQTIYIDDDTVRLDIRPYSFQFMPFIAFFEQETREPLHLSLGSIHLGESNRIIVGNISTQSLSKFGDINPETMCSIWINGSLATSAKFLGKKDMFLRFRTEIIKLSSHLALDSFLIQLASTNFQPVLD